MYVTLPQQAVILQVKPCYFINDKSYYKIDQGLIIVVPGFVSSMEVINTSIHVRYASQTGTTIDLAKQFCSRVHTTSLRSIDDNTHNELVHWTQNIGPDGANPQHKTIWVFFIATTGQGDVPRSLKAAWQALKKKSQQRMEGVQFAVYGLGDSSYGDNYNVAARRFRQRLIGLGALQIIPIGLGNEQDKLGYRECFELAWLPAFIDTVKPRVNKDKPVSHLQLTCDRTTFTPITISKIVPLTLRPQRATYLIQMQAKQLSSIQGSVLQIFPHNRPDSVEKVLTHLKATGDELFQLNGVSFSYRILLSEYLNIDFPVNFGFFVNYNHLRPLSSLVELPLLAEKLTELSKSFDQYDNYIRKYKRNVVEVIQDFNLNVTMIDLVVRLSCIQPRKFSIALYHSANTFSILMRESVRQINAHRIYRGVCSSDLANAKQGTVRLGRFTIGDLGLSTPITPMSLTKNRSVIILTQGVGVASVTALLQTLKPDGRVLMLLANRYRDQLYLDLEPFALLQNVHLVATFTREPKGSNIYFHPPSARNPNLQKALLQAQSMRLPSVLAVTYQDLILPFMKEQPNYQIVMCCQKSLVDTLTAQLVGWIGEGVRTRVKYENW